MAEIRAPSFSPWFCAAVDKRPALSQWKDESGAQDGLAQLPAPRQDSSTEVIRQGDYRGLRRTNNLSHIPVRQNGLDSGAYSRVYSCPMQTPNHAIAALQIGDVARLVAVSVDAIRFYERSSLLPPAPRTAGRFRLYAKEDVARLAFIKQMQGLGFSLQEVRQLLDLREHSQESCPEVRDLLHNKLEKVRTKI